MAWTAALTGKTKDPSNGNIVVVLQFTSDTGERQTRTVPGNDFTNTSVAKYAANVIAALNARDASYDALTVGPVTPYAPTPEEQAVIDANAATQTALADLAYKNQLIALGVKSAGDADVVAAQAAAKAAISQAAAATAAISTAVAGEATAAVIK